MYNRVKEKDMLRFMLTPVVVVLGSLGDVPNCKRRPVHDSEDRNCAPMRKKTPGIVVKEFLLGRARFKVAGSAECGLEKVEEYAAHDPALRACSPQISRGTTPLRIGGECVPSFAPPTVTGS